MTEDYRHEDTPRDNESQGTSELGLRDAGILNIRTNRSLPFSNEPQLTDPMTTAQPLTVVKKYRTHFTILEPIEFDCNHYVF